MSVAGVRTDTARTRAHVANWHKADIPLSPGNVAFGGKADPLRVTVAKIPGQIRLLAHFAGICIAAHLDNSALVELRLSRVFGHREGAYAASF